MNRIILTCFVVGLAVCGCNRKADVPADASVIPAAPPSAVTVVSAEPVPSASAAMAEDMNAAPAASAVDKIPVQEDFEKKAKTVVSSKANAVRELTKIEKEIGE